jgi:hypothetical protein
MSSPMMPAPLGGPLASAASLLANGGQAGEDSRSAPETVRRNHLAEESYVKAVGKSNFALTVAFGTMAGYYLRTTFMHASGSINAPWMLKPAWIALQINLCVLTLILAIAGYGF